MGDAEEPGAGQPPGGGARQGGGRSASPARRARPPPPAGGETELGVWGACEGAGARVGGGAARESSGRHGHSKQLLIVAVTRLCAAPVGAGGAPGPWEGGGHAPSAGWAEYAFTDAAACPAVCVSRKEQEPASPREAGARARPGAHLPPGGPLGGVPGPTPRSQARWPRGRGLGAWRYNRASRGLGRAWLLLQRVHLCGQPRRHCYHGSGRHSALLFAVKDARHANSSRRSGDQQQTPPGRPGRRAWQVGAPSVGGGASARRGRGGDVRAPAAAPAATHVASGHLGWPRARARSCVACSRPSRATPPCPAHVSSRTQGRLQAALRRSPAPAVAAVAKRWP